MRNTVRVLCIAAVAMLAAGVASAQSASVLGDVNGDGQVNILDIQAAIVQALQVVPPAALADVDGSASVDVGDVQHLINTALGTGGLVQRLKGNLASAADLLNKGMHLVAVSTDGDQVAATVDPATGAFTITLPVKKKWSFIFATDPDANGNQDAGTVQFPLNGTLTSLLPLLDLSHCDVLDLGTLNFGGQMTAPQDLRALLASINKDEVLKDGDGNGIPDVLDKLLDEAAKIHFDVGGTHVDLSGLVDLVKPCIKDHIADMSNISLADANHNRIPDFLEPLIQCLRDSLKTWLQDMGVTVPDGLIDFAMQTFVTPQLLPLLHLLNVPALADANGNGIPDILEGLGLPPLPPAIDANGNGIPDFLEHRPPHGGEGEGEGELVAVPDLVGMALADAQAAITAAGLIAGPVGHQFDETAPVDQVIHQMPLAGAKIPADMPVGVVVSKGPRPAPVAVPNVIGMTQADALTALSGAGFAVGLIVEIHDATAAVGTVFHQLPEAGKMVPPGVPVNLVVSLGPKA